MPVGLVRVIRLAYWLWPLYTAQGGCTLSVYKRLRRHASQAPSELKYRMVSPKLGQYAGLGVLEPCLGGTARPKMSWSLVGWYYLC